MHTLMSQLSHLQIELLDEIVQICCQTAHKVTLEVRRLRAMGRRIGRGTHSGFSESPWKRMSNL